LSQPLKSVYLLRHAKSSWDDPDLDDADRPLAPRGREAAARIAAHIRERRIAPQLVTCSPALRARQTLEGLGDSIGDARVEIDAGIYDAHESDLLEILRRVEPEITSTMMIGHNPSIERLALLLAAENTLLDDLRHKFPTAALATLAFEVADWHELRAGSGELTEFVKPRELG
jgi:phosphohistidine phosphatase